MGKEPLQQLREFEQGMKLLSSHQQKKVLMTIELFLEDPYAEILGNHPLRETHPDIRSISVDEDLRIILRKGQANTILLMDVGDHLRVYRKY